MISRWVPDAITASVILTFTTLAVALALGSSAHPQVMDAYHQGLWMLLPFTMQMTLIMVLSAGASGDAGFPEGHCRLARIPNTRNQFIAFAFLICGITSYLYWGLGYALNPIIAIYFAAEAERKDMAIDFPFLLAVTTAAQALWQYGVSASAPLLVASQGHFLESTIGVVPLSTTIWSPAAMIHEVVFGAAAVLTSCWMMPKKVRPISRYPESLALAKAIGAVEKEDQRGLGFAQRMERSPLVPLALGSLLAGWLFYHFVTKRLSHDINSLNITLLLLGLLLHRTVKRFAAALEQGAGRSWAVIVLYHLYAGVAGLIQYTAWATRWSGWLPRSARSPPFR